MHTWELYSVIWQSLLCGVCDSVEGVCDSVEKYFHAFLRIIMQTVRYKVARLVYEEVHVFSCRIGRNLEFVFAGLPILHFTKHPQSRRSVPVCYEFGSIRILEQCALHDTYYLHMKSPLNSITE